MNFDRNDEKLSSEYTDWLDCRMIAFKQKLMNCRTLYWDMVDSRKMLPSHRLEVQEKLINYIKNLQKIHPEAVTDFDITKREKLLKKEMYKGNYWLQYGDAIMINITDNANIEGIVNDLSSQVLNGGDARVAIGYYTGNNDFVSPGDDLYILESEYFKNQMVLGKVNDTMPSEEQIQEYYTNNIRHIQNIERIHAVDIYSNKKNELER